MQMTSLVSQAYSVLLLLNQVFTVSCVLADCRDINRAQVARKKEAIAYFSIESALALLISLFIILCVVSVFAKGFYGKETGDIGLKNAGDYLGQRFGSHMVGNVGCGLLHGQCCTFLWSAQLSCVTTVIE